MYSIHTLHNIPSDANSGHNCDNLLSTFTLEQGTNQLEYPFLRDVILIRRDNELVIFSPSRNGVLGKYQIENRFFVRNSTLYFIGKDQICSIYPEYKQVFTTENIVDIYSYGRYIIVTHGKDLNKIHEKQWYMDIFDSDFNFYFSFPKQNTPRNIFCNCNEHILIIFTGGLKEYFDIENKIVIDSGDFRKWLKLDDKMVLEEKGTSKNILIKRICDYDEKVSDNDCSICFDEIEKRVALIPCGHTKFCEKCITSLKNKKCPLCNKDFKEFLRIYS